MARIRARTEQPERVLRAAATHVRYELDMMRYATSLLGPIAASPPSWGSGPQHAMAMECFLLHFRNLRAFLCPSIHLIKQTDVIASDFLGSRVGIDYLEPRFFEADKDRLDQMLAHLSYNRENHIDSGNFEWKVAAFTELILSGFEEFLASIPPAREAWFPSRRQIAEYRARAADRFAGLYPVHGLPTGPGPTEG